MHTIKGDLFKPSTYGFHPDAICITTNGFVKKNGDAVMGRGCAAEAAKRWPHVIRELGKYNSAYGNDVEPMILSQEFLEGKSVYVLSFPVKPAWGKCNPEKSNVVTHMRNKINPGESVPGWMHIGSYSLIERSAIILAKMVDERPNWKRIVLPRPGCGAGELKWELIKDILSPVLDDRFYVITY